MIKLIQKIIHEIKYKKEERENWKMKMNVPLRFEIVYTPPTTGTKTE